MLSKRKYFETHNAVTGTWTVPPKLLLQPMLLFGGGVGMLGGGA